MIGKHQPVSREEINELLLDKLPEVLNEDKKMDKIHNISFHPYPEKEFAVGFDWRSHLVKLRRV